MTRLEIDAERCTGHGRCYDIAPGLFQADEYGHGQVIDGLTHAEFDEELAMDAVQACPENAIRLKA